MYTHVVSFTCGTRARLHVRAPRAKSFCQAAIAIHRRSGPRPQRLQLMPYLACLRCPSTASRLKPLVAVARATLASLDAITLAQHLLGLVGLMLSVCSAHSLLSSDRLVVREGCIGRAAKSGCVRPFQALLSPLTRSADYCKGPLRAGCCIAKYWVQWAGLRAEQASGCSACRFWRWRVGASRRRRLRRWVGVPPKDRRRVLTTAIAPAHVVSVATSAILGPVGRPRPCPPWIADMPQKRRG